MATTLTIADEVRRLYGDTGEVAVARGWGPASDPNGTAGGRRHRPVGHDSTLVRPTVRADRRLVADQPPSTVDLVTSCSSPSVDMLLMGAIPTHVGDALEASDGGSR